jgi:photosystem II stability/assembly factor-like uncharacterized protein
MMPKSASRIMHNTGHWLDVLFLLSLLLIIPTPLFAGEDWKQTRYEQGVPAEARPPVVGFWTVEGPATLALGIAATNTGILIVVGDQGFVLRSTDDARSWQPIKTEIDATLLGVVAVAKTGTLIAVGDDGTVLRSADGGLRWEKIEKKTHATLLGVVAAKTGTLIAVGNRGAVLRSLDDGKTWKQVDNKAGVTLWGVTAANTTFVAVGDDGTILRGTYDGEVWTEIKAQSDATLRGVAAAGTGTLIAVGDQGTVLRSIDDGKSWKQIDKKTDATLGAVATADTGTLIAVGEQGTVLRSTNDGQFWTRDRNSTIAHLNSVAAIPRLGRMIAGVDGGLLLEQPQSAQTAAVPTELAFASAGKTLSLSWHYSSQQLPACQNVFYRIKNDQADVLIGAPDKIGDQKLPVYRITWQPPAQIAANTPIYYVIECTDPNLAVTWRQPLLSDSQVWMPYSSLWKQLQDLSNRALAGVVAATLLLIWVLALLSLYAVFPEKLVLLHELLPQPRATDNAARRLDKFLFGFVALGFWLGHTMMFFLGSSRRALDFWIAGRLTKAREIFLGLPVVYDRRIAIELPVSIERTRQDQPWAVLGRIFSRPTMALQIAGPGGAGKTTLACRIARRAMGEDGRAPLAGYPILPLLIEQDIPEEAAKVDGLCPYLAGLLRSALGQSRMISPALMEALLRTGRVMPIIDGFSERSAATRQAFDSSRQGFPATKLVITSRETALSRAVVLEMQTIPPGALYDFIERYLRLLTESAANPMPSEERILQACADLSRLLRDTPTTPLLAAMWAGEIAKPASDQARGVADLMDRYVRRILLPAAGGDEALIERLRADAAAIAVCELGMGFQPGYVTRANTLRTLRELDPQQPERRLDLLLKSRLLEEPSRDSDMLRIAPDPVAEHMVARQRTEALGGDSKGWDAFVRDLQKAGWPEGFVAALRACADHHIYGPLVQPTVHELFRSDRRSRGRE